VSTRRRSRKKALSSADKWKGKSWVEVKAPLYVNDSVIGKTCATDINKITGRTLKTSLMDLSGSFKDIHKLMTFKLTEIKGAMAHTEFYEYELSRDYMRSMVRNHRSRIDGIVNLKLTDGSRVRVTVFSVTPMRAKASDKHEIRQIIFRTLLEETKDLNLASFVNKIIDNSLNASIYEAVENYFPLKILEIAKIKVIKTSSN
jgi:small subunit ribosomal protein S3Ae